MNASADNPIRDARNRRAIDAAMQLAREGGYDAVQMRAVAALADIALGTLYRLFSSKDHLLAAAYATWAADMTQRVEERPPRGASAAERVSEVLRRAAKAQALQPRLMSALMKAISSPEPPVAECVAAVEGSMARAIELAIGDHPIDADRRASVTDVIGAVWFALLLGWSRGSPRGADLGGQLERTAHLLLDER